MKNKLFLIFIVLILLSVSGVSASDINQTSIDDVDNSVLSTSNDVIVDTVSASENDLGILNVSDDSNYINQSADTGTFTDLYNLILNTNDETLELTRDYKYNNNTDYALVDGMSIYKEITINGQNYLIDGVSQATIFWVHSNVILKNIHFINGKISIFNYDEAKSSIFNCTFINGINGESSILNYNEATIFNCTFINNGGISNTGYMDVFNCSFVNNSAGAGGAIWGASNIFNCSFVNNSAVVGGAISGASNIFNCSFVNNSASNGGGAISGASNIFNCSFVNNSAGDSGGAICGNGVAGNIFNCSFVNNSAGNRGGAVYNIDNEVVVDSCSFVNNSAGGGGAVYNVGNVFNCSFVNNSAGGGAVYNVGNVFNCSFVNNSASSDSGSVIEGSGVVDSCSFVNNSVDCDIYGCGVNNCINVRISDGGIVNNCTFINTSSVSAYEFNNCIFINNSASNGGAISHAHIVFNCSFVNNSASNGGAIYMEWDNCTVFNCSFVNNSASNGGAIYSYSLGSLNVFNCSFVNNFAGDGGGAICGNGVNGVVDSCSFVNNFAGDGGAIDGSAFSFSNCSFVSNSAGAHGGAIYGDGESSNCSFVSNSAVYGGAIAGSVDVDSCSFVNNSASIGGAIRRVHEIGDFSNCSFVNNSASSGGAISSDSNTLNVTNCSFMSNSATWNGGAITFYGYYPCCMSVFNCSFVSNSAGDGGGGAIYGNGVVDSCSFVNNSVDWGGIIHMQGSIDNYISNSIFENNMKYSIYIGENDWISWSETSLNKNLLNNGLIYNKGNIISPKTIVVLNNKTINTSNKEFILNATIYDDNGNIIICDVDNFNFIVNYELIKGILENDTFKAHVNLDEGKNIIDAVSFNTNDTVKIGIINLDMDINISAPDVTKYYGGTERFIVTLKDKNNKAIANENVSITINGKSYTRTTNNDGEASIAINLNSDVYPVTTEYKGQKVDSKVTIISTIQSKDITKIFRNDTQYYATFLDNKGNFLKNKDVTFNINGVFYIRTTNDKGVAKLNINLQQGDYIITATNPVTHEQRSNIVKVLPSIIENDNITKYYKNGTQYVVKVLNLDGSVAGAGVNVTFNINGVFYTRTTNASGHAKLNINLAPDEYTITAEYNNLRVSNKIKVLPVLSAEDLSMSYKDGSKFEAKLLDGQGNAYASQTIKFNINGVFYDRTTDENGIAKLNINLMSGKYIITSMYNGAAISNEVTIS